MKIPYLFFFVVCKTNSSACYNNVRVLFSPLSLFVFFCMCVCVCVRESFAVLSEDYRAPLFYIYLLILVGWVLSLLSCLLVVQLS